MVLEATTKPAVEGATLNEATPEQEAASQEEIDYKAEYARLVAELAESNKKMAKTENDLKAVQGNRKSQADRDAAVLDAIAGQGATLKAALKALERDNPEVAEAIKAGEDEVQKQRVNRLTMRRYEAFRESAQTMLADEVVSAHPEVVALVPKWNANWNADKADIDAIHDLHTELASISVRIYREQVAAEKANVKKAADAAERKARADADEANGRFKVGSGKGAAAGGGPGSWEQVLKAKDVSGLSDDDYGALLAKARSQRS